MYRGRVCKPTVGIFLITDLSLVVGSWLLHVGFLSCSAWASHCSGLGAEHSSRAFSLQELQHRLSSCGAWSRLL